MAFSGKSAHHWLKQHFSRARGANSQLDRHAASNLRRSTQPPAGFGLTLAGNEVSVAKPLCIVEYRDHDGSDAKDLYVIWRGHGERERERELLGVFRRELAQYFRGFCPVDHFGRVCRHGKSFAGHDVWCVVIYGR